MNVSWGWVPAGTVVDWNVIEAVAPVPVTAASAVPGTAITPAAAAAVRSAAAPHLPFESFIVISFTSVVRYRRVQPGDRCQADPRRQITSGASPPSPVPN